MLSNMVLWCEWMKIFRRYLHHEGGNCQKSYFEVFSRAGSDWPLCKISTLTATPFMFFVHKYLIFDKYLPEIFSMNLWSVFQLSQTASDGFDWNWVKSGPLLFVIFQILNAMDRPIVQWKPGRCGTILERVHFARNSIKDCFISIPYFAQKQYAFFVIVIAFVFSLKYMYRIPRVYFA